MALIFYVLVLFSPIQAQFVLPIQKCCEENQVFDRSSKTCKNFEGFQNVSLNLNLPEDNPINVTDYGFIECTEEGAVRHFLYQPNQEDIDNPQLAYQFLPDENNTGIQLFDFEEASGYSEYCFDRYYNLGKFAANKEHLGTVAQVCKVPDSYYCQKNPCIRTCCSWGTFLDPDTRQCEFNADLSDINSTWIFGPDFTPFQDSQEKYNDIRDIYLNGRMECGGTITYSEGEFHMSFHSDGTVFIEEVPFFYDEYCVNVAEKRTDEGQLKYDKQVIVCKNVDKSCAGGFLSWFCLVDLQVIPSLFILSMLFLGLLIIHIWRNQREKLFGWLTLGAVSMLFIFYLVLAIVKFFGATHLKDYPILCEIEALIVQYSYMSALMWLNSMSFFMWKAFRVLKARANVVVKYKYGCQHPKFKWYALYAWGPPLLVTIGTLVMQHLPEDIIDADNPYAPQIGLRQCFLGSGFPTLIYFHIFNAPVLVTNMIFFSCFLWSMLCGIWSNQNGDPSIAQQNKKRLHVVIKMFFVMGITWIAEIVSWLVGWAQGYENVYKEIFLFQLLNALQGFILFCVLFFDSTRLKAIWEKIKGCKCKGSAQSKEYNVQRNSKTLSTLTSWTRTSGISNRMAKLDVEELKEIK